MNKINLLIIFSFCFAQSIFSFRIEDGIGIIETTKDWVIVESYIRSGGLSPEEKAELEKYLEKYDDDMNLIEEQKLDENND